MAATKALLYAFLLTSVISLRVRCDTNEAAVCNRTTTNPSLPFSCLL